MLDVMDLRQITMRKSELDKTQIHTHKITVNPPQTPQASPRPVPQTGKYRHCGLVSSLLVSVYQDPGGNFELLRLIRVPDYRQASHVNPRGSENKLVW